MHLYLYFFFFNFYTETSSKTRRRISAALHRLAQNPQTPDVLPSRLRPKSSTTQEPALPERLTGNIITDVSKCELHFNSCIRNHLREFPDCSGDIIFDPDSFSTWGLAIAGRMKCSSNCGFISEKLKFYEEVERKGRGRKAAKINTQLQVILTKQPIGNSGVREILASIDTPCPSESGMQKNANKVSDAFHTIAEKQLAKNRELVKSVLELRGGCEMDTEVPVIVAQSDVAYNNPVKGRVFYQPGTQSWAPCFASVYGLEHLPIAFRTRSKLCSCPYDGETVQHREWCTKNFSSEQAMRNSEYQLGKDLARELIEGESPLGISTLVTDGDSHLHRGMQEVMSDFGVSTEKGDCTRHVSKSIGRNIRKAKLSIRCLGGAGTTVQERERNKRTLGYFLERRCTMEFRAAYRRYGGNVQKLETTCQLAKLGILGCIQGHADVCRKGSLVCGAHRWKSGNRVSIFCAISSYFLVGRPT